jgi:hypothetical protein
VSKVLICPVRPSLRVCIIHLTLKIINGYIVALRTEVERRNNYVPDNLNTTDWPVNNPEGN